MPLPIRVLPILENWDCHGCGICCRGAVVVLNERDLERIRRQGWDKDPDFRGKKILVRLGLFDKRYRLAQRNDGVCIFQDADKLCRIHKKFGYEAKPHVCRMAPLQLVPLENMAYVTLRRYCPSAAADRGCSLKEQLSELRELLKQSGEEPLPSRPPTLTRGHRRPWKDAEALNGSLSRLIQDGRFPLVRRLVHGLDLCALLNACNLRSFKGQRLVELLSMLEKSAIEDSASLFNNRTEPKRQAGKLFRQTILEYLRLHPDFTGEYSWRERWRLISAAFRFGRGTGAIPQFHLPFHPASFESQERSLGPLAETVLKPFNSYFETAVVSWRYAMLKRSGWSMVESFWDLALSYCVGMWVLRLACTGREPDVEDVIRVVMMLDRGQTHASLTGFRHRLRVRALAHNDQLSRLAVWYAR
jgi:lysine-N-methylase